jgi:hypothetical protein
MSINYVTDRFLAKLKNAVSNSINRYTSNENWAQKLASGERFFRETGIQFEAYKPLSVPGDDDYSESENAIRVFRSLGSVSPTQAIDERLWVYMTHIIWWDYMVKRWPVDLGDTDKAKRVVLRRFFVQGRGLRPLALNGISRLWWAAYLTYDSGRNDPYELTRVFMSRTDIATGLLERSMGKNRNILCSFVEFLRDHMDEIEEVWSGSGGPGKAIQHMARELNRRGGVVVLDAIGRGGIHDIMRQAMHPRN